MDPISQGAVGAAVAVAASRRPHYFQAALLGALGGMAPDLDVLIRSDTDPLLTLTYHRQFTHSLLFIPIIGGLCALLAYQLWGKRCHLTIRQCLLWSILGCATHGLLDGCTSYGTQLLWPFSEQRIAWDIISVIDPLFTLPLLVILGLSLGRPQTPWKYVSIAWMVLYLGIGSWQHQRALALGQALAESRHHQPLQLQAKPSFANLVVWKVIYAVDNTVYVDAVKPGWNQPRLWQGERIEKLNPQQAFPWLTRDMQQWRDIQRFSTFSQGYIAINPDNPQQVFDVRYSMLPDRIDPMWGITLQRTKQASQYSVFFTERQDSQAAMRSLWLMIAGE